MSCIFFCIFYVYSVYSLINFENIIIISCFQQILMRFNDTKITIFWNKFIKIRIKLEQTNIT